MELRYDIKEEKTLFNKLIKTANEHFNLDNFTQSFPKIILRMFYSQMLMKKINEFEKTDIYIVNF